MQKATPVKIVNEPSADTAPRPFRRYPRPSDDDPDEKSFGQGSGIIIREDGFILTNGHVVDEAEKVEVRLHDGRRFTATVRGIDPQSDIAVLKIDARGLPAAVFADSAKVRVGEFAIAIGAPFGLDYSITFGHVSAKGRSNILLLGEAPTMMDQDFVQTDASINPGNSGGPLVNIEGEVIGINTLIRGIHTGIGFAIPSSLAREVSDQLIANGKFVRTWLGVSIRDSKEDRDFIDSPPEIEKGVIIEYLVPGGPASKAGLRVHDIIVSIDGHKVETTQQLRAEVRHAKPGTALNLTIERAAKTMEIKVTPAEFQPAEVVQASRKASVPGNSETFFGMTVHPITEEITRQFTTTATNGVIVVAVDDRSVAALKGIQPGDVITSVDQREVHGMTDFWKAVKKANQKKGVLLTLESGVSSRNEMLKAP